MDLKYKVGDRVCFMRNAIPTKGIIKSIRIPSIMQRDKIDLLEMGLIEEESLYKFMIAEVYAENSRTYNVNMSKISKVEEKEEKKMEVKPNIPKNVTNKVNNLDIVDYKILNEKAILFVFADGTTVTTVCSEEDKYNLEEAINVAICKKKFGGTSEYNNAIRKGIKQVKAIDLKREREAAEQKELERRRAKRLERKLRRKEAKRQEQIDIQAEAFYKALQMCDDQLKDDDKITMKKLRRLFNTTK